MSEESASAQIPEAESAAAAAAGLMGAHEPTIDAVNEQSVGAPLELIATVAARLDTLEQMLSGLTDTITTLSRNQEIMQGAMRQLSVRVSEAALSLAAPRVRELYLRLLLLYDMVSPLPVGHSDDARHISGLLATQIEEFLAVNGFERIPANGEFFDPKLHKPLEFVTTEDPSMEGRVTATLRTGFRSGSQVLRPAEVVVARAPAEP